MLGLTDGRSLADAKRAYHASAKRNHPDLFPDAQRQRQQLAMIRINEAYMAVVADLSGRASDAAGTTAEGNATPGSTRSDGMGQAGEYDGFFSTWQQKARRGPISQSTELGQLRDPAYAYYKAGFTYYNRGATELYRKEGKQLRRFLLDGGSFDAYVLRLVIRALHYFERSYSYFLVVVEQYPSSPWYADSKWKLYRLERYNAIYQRICENLARRSSSKRSSFSIVNGADPS
jgi:curved DNA-binding protein CbpA